MYIARWEKAKGRKVKMGLWQPSRIIPRIPVTGGEILRGAFISNRRTMLL